MTGDKMLLLCMIIVILGLWQGGEAYKCSSRADSLPASFWKDTLMSTCPDNSSGTCTPEVTVVLRYDSLESWRAIVYVLIDLAPLMVYLPLLILFNANLAAGPTQSFLFFYQALPAAVAIDFFPISYPIAGGLWWGLFTMQSPINYFLSSRLIPGEYRLFPDANVVKSCAFYCRELEYLSTDHHPYFTVAVIMLLLSLLLPLLLLYYPAVPALMKRIVNHVWGS